MCQCRPACRAQFGRPAAVTGNSELGTKKKIGKFNLGKKKNTFMSFAELFFFCSTSVF